jgi:replicative DNA helicase
MCALLDRGAVADPVSVSHELGETHQLEAIGGKDISAG